MNNAIASILESHKGGVWFLPGGEARALQSAAKKAGYTYVHIDGSKIERKEQLLNHLATALRVEPRLTSFVTYDKRLADAARVAGLTVDAPA